MRNKVESKLKDLFSQKIAENEKKNKIVVINEMN
jgi:hypothetical protein